MTGFSRIIAPFMVALALVPTAQAAEAKTRFQPALVYYLPANPSNAKSTQTDNAFVDSARTGISKATSEYGVSVSEYRVTDADQIASTLKKAADAGASPIIALGALNVTPVLTMAERYPNTQFTVIDGLVPPILPNVQSILFKDHEGAFLVGYIAGRISKSGHVGFIGGMDSPVIQNFATGYSQGVKYANSSAEITVDMIGKTAAAWNNPERGKDLALRQFNNGSDVIFAAAGGSSLGVLSAANQSHKYAIGVDTNQNGLFPGRVLTSLVKRVDIATYDALKKSRDGSWSPGIKYLGIKEGALDYAVDDNNRNLITESLIEDVSNAKERIINGIITVNAYQPK